MARYSNALASIHTVLKRMEETGELIERDRDEDTRSKAYVYGTRVIASRVGNLRSWSKRKPGEGLCPPKDRKK